MSPLLLAVTVVACAGLDDTAAIQSAVLSGDVRVSGFCRVDGAGVRIPSGRRLDLAEATLALKPGCERCRVLETVVGAEDVAIVGGTFLGDATAPICASCWQIAVRVDGAGRATVRGGTFRDWTDAVWVGGNGAGSVDVVLSELDVRGSRRSGVSVTNGAGVSLERSFLGEAHPEALVGAGVNVEPNQGERVDDVVIRANTFRGNRVGIYDHPGRGLPGARHEISRNVIAASGTHALILNSVAHAAVVDNVVEGAPVGISVGAHTEDVRAVDVLVWGNRITATRPLILAGVRDSRFLSNDLGGGRVETVALGAAGRVAVEPVEVCQ